MQYTAQGMTVWPADITDPAGTLFNVGVGGSHAWYVAPRADTEEQALSWLLVNLDVDAGAKVSAGDYVGYVEEAGELRIYSPLTGEIVKVGPYPRRPAEDGPAMWEWEALRDEGGCAYQGWLFQIRAEGPIPEFLDTEPNPRGDS